MSSYEDYTRTAASYDATRVAVGLEIILGALVRVGKPLADMVLLDAGCGTGTYIEALVGHVGRVAGVDANAQMLAQARSKLGPALARGQASLHRAAIDALPLAPRSVDAVMVNQVLHHLGDGPARGWSRTRRVIEEFARILRPGGVLVINTCSQEQLRRGWWYLALMPRVVEDMCERHMPLDALDAMLSAGGFVARGRYVPVDATIQGVHYRDGLGPTREAWRRGDSIWARVSDEEQARITARIRALHAAGELDAFVERLDAPRRDLGQVTFLVAERARDATAT